MAANKDFPHLLKAGTFASAVEGAHIAFRQYSYSPNPANKIKHIIFQHGAVEHHKRHMDLIAALLKAFKNGAVVSCMDLVGHGYSGGSRAYVDSIDSYVEDFIGFASSLSDLHHQKEVEGVYLIAHSLGGMIALKTAVDHRDQLPFNIDAMILTNPCLKTKVKLPSFGKKLVEGVAGALGKARAPSIYRGKDLTGDPEKAASFDRDPLISDFITAGMANAIVKESALIMAYSYYLQTPTLFILSGRDVIVDNDATELFIGGVDKALASVSRYAEAKHDILSDTCAKEVFQEIIDYIQQTQRERK